MEWTEIIYDGTEVEAVDLLDGVVVDIPGKGLVFVPGYYVLMQSGDRDVPRLERRKRFSPTFSIRLVEDE